MPGIDQARRDRAPDESRTAGDEHLHEMSLSIDPGPQTRLADVTEPALSQTGDRYRAQVIFKDTQL
ncbi:hypothetical protein Ato02nite_031290 [Paractinoplanes toevensis]|uniref:Uncharacterized protein n=1 Tax=Paractinoplanes toevensis TaxID=571911 RepID=A0A919TAT5_9ACTN|nr:hypothetical protein Ato02nite_031290 [Actinoplanes toevensis]